MSAAKMVADSTQGDLDEPKKKRKRKKEKEKEKSKKLKKKDSRKGKGRKKEDDDSDLDLDKELLPIGDYIKERHQMNEQLFHCLRGPVLQRYVPEVLKELPLEELKKRCLEHLEIMSKKRIRRILEGDDPSLISSSGTEEESSMDEQEVGETVEEDINKSTEDKESEVDEVKRSEEEDGERGSEDDQNSDLDDENRSGDETGRDTQSSESELGDTQGDELEEGETVSDVEGDENRSDKDDVDERSEDGDKSMKSEGEVSSEESDEEQDDERDETDVGNDNVKDTSVEICEKEKTGEEMNNTVKETQEKAPSRIYPIDNDSENEREVDDSVLTRESDEQTTTSNTVIPTGDNLDHSIKRDKDFSCQNEDGVSIDTGSVSHNKENVTGDSQSAEQNYQSVNVLGDSQLAEQKIQSDTSIISSSPNKPQDDCLSGDKTSTNQNSSKSSNDTDTEDVVSLRDEDTSLLDNPSRVLSKSPVNDTSIPVSSTLNDTQIDTPSSGHSKSLEMSDDNASTKSLYLSLKTKSRLENMSEVVPQKENDSKEDKDSQSGILQDSQSGMLQDSQSGMLQDSQSGMLQDSQSGVLQDSRPETDGRKVELGIKQKSTSGEKRKLTESDSRSVVLSTKPVMVKTEGSIEMRLGPVKQSGMSSSSSYKSVQQRLGPKKNTSKTSTVLKQTVVTKEPLSKPSSSSNVSSKSVLEEASNPLSKSVSKTAASDIVSKPSSISSVTKGSLSHESKTSTSKSVSKSSSKQLPQSSSKEIEGALAPVLTKNQMELLELEMRARAIKAMLAAHEKKEAKLQKEGKTK